MVIPAVFLLASLDGKDFTKVKTIDVKANMLALDPLGNIYVVKDHELIKYDAKGTELFTFSNFLAGKITSVDPSDPFKVLVYYSEFGQVDILDRNLARTIDPILLQSYGLELATLVCRSYNSGLWVYDPVNFELIRLDQNMQQTDRTGFINQIVGSEINPTNLLEADNNVFLSDPETGVIMFDRFGTYLLTYPFMQVKSLQHQGSKLVYFDGKKVQAYDTRKLVSSEMKSIPGNLLDFKLNLTKEPQRMYLLDPEGLTIFEKK
jgi:hypothetical protein